MAVKVNIDLYCIAPCCEHTSKALYGTSSQGISQFYLHTPRSSANEMNHTCLCLPSRSWYSFSDPEGWKAEFPLGGWLVTYWNKCLSLGIEPGRGVEVVQELMVCNSGWMCDVLHYTLLLTFWRWPTNMYKLRCCIDSEAYTSGLSGTPGCPAEILHCLFFEGHFWKGGQSIYH